MIENKGTFFARVEPYLSPREKRQLAIAYMMAKFGHRHQTRKELDAKGDPLRYFEHLRRVAIVLMDEVKHFDLTMIIAALLHDSLEDTEDVTDEIIEHIFGEDVCHIVKSLSKVPKEGYIDRLSQCTDWRILVLKGCDRLDNLRSLHSGSREFQEKQIEETISKYMSIFQRMVDITPIAFSRRSQRLKDLITSEIYTLKGSLSQSNLNSLS